MRKYIVGGAVGFIGYEFIHDVEPVVPRPPRDDLRTPTMYFLIADQFLIFDRVLQTITVLVNAIVDDKAASLEAYEDATGEIERMVSLLEQPCEYQPVSLPPEVPSIRSEEHTSELQSQSNLVCRLLLEKKKEQQLIG